MSKPLRARVKSIGTSFLVISASAAVVVALVWGSQVEMIGRYDNRADPYERIEFRGGKAHVYCGRGANDWMEFTGAWVEPQGNPNYAYTPAERARMRYKVEVLNFTRQGERLTLHTATGDREFTVASGMTLTGPNGTTWDRKYNND